MTEIFVDPSKKKITVQVESQSLAAVGLTITVYAADKTTVLEQFSDDTRTSNPFTQDLKNSPASYKGCYISGTFTVIFLDGKDYSYTILFSILLDGATVTPNIPITSKTQGSTDSATATFHAN